jgi:hypothetical protein
MGYFTRREQLVADIFNHPTLGKEKKLAALETLVGVVYGEAQHELLEELDQHDHSETEMEEVRDFLYISAAQLNHALAGTGIEWEGSTVGTTEWLNNQREFVSDKTFEKLSKNPVPSAKDDIVQ